MVGRVKFEVWNPVHKYWAGAWSPAALLLNNVELYTSYGYTVRVAGWLHEPKKAAA